MCRSDPADLLFVDEHPAEQIQALYKAYLSGDALRTAAIKVGIDAFPAGIGKILKNPHYLGDNYYPLINMKIA